MYEEQIQQKTPVSDVRTWDAEMRPDGEPDEIIAEIVTELGLSDANRVLFDNTMQARFTHDLQTHIDAEFGLSEEVLWSFRIQKDSTELTKLRRSVTIADQVATEIRQMGSDVVGMAESELASEIESRLEDTGGDGLPYEIVVASGPNGATPHHSSGERIIRAGEPVILDFGTLVDGYSSDQSRTLIFGSEDGQNKAEPSEKFEVIHDTVRRAQQAAVDTVEPGVPAKNVDRTAREVIEDAGYGDRFVHRTGHGVGLELREDQFITPSNEMELKEGMVFSVEPGIYLEGEFGVRIEDLVVVVTKDGCERLNHSDRGWRTGI